MAELRRAAQTAFYAKTEATFSSFYCWFCPAPGGSGLLGLARQLASEFPDNSRFQVDYAKRCFDQGQWEAAEATCQTVFAKNSRGCVYDEALAGRTTAYTLGCLQQHRYHNLAKAQDYYRYCLVFSGTIQLTSGYYVFASAALGNLAAQQQVWPRPVATTRW